MVFASSSEIRVIIGGHYCAQPSLAIAGFLRDHMAIHLPACKPPQPLLINHCSAHVSDIDLA